MNNAFSRNTTVILIHGLWTSGWMMHLHKTRLKRSGFQVHTFSYPTMKYGLAETARHLSRFASSLDGAETMHFVGHSLGGLLILKMLYCAPPQGVNIGRSILLGTPCLTSITAQTLKQWIIGPRMLGPCMREYLDSEKPILDDNFEVGVIAGSRSLGLGRLVCYDLPRPNDGVVTVEETRLPNLRDHIVLPVSHSGMLVSNEVSKRMVHFLERGSFT